MEEYYCTKKVRAKQMSRFEAQKLELIRDVTSIDEDGYFVKYEDGYTSWSPRAVFESGYAPTKEQPRGII